MFQFGVRLNTPRFVAAWKAAPQALARTLPPALRAFGRAYVAKETREFLSGRRPDDMGLNRVTGNLARTLSTSVTGNTLDTIKFNVVFGASYAAKHETGFRGESTFVNRRTGETYTRHVNLPPRLGAVMTLKAMTPQLVSALNQAADAAMGQPPAEGAANANP